MIVIDGELWDRTRKVCMYIEHSTLKIIISVTIFLFNFFFKAYEYIKDKMLNHSFNPFFLEYKIETKL